MINYKSADPFNARQFNEVYDTLESVIDMLDDRSLKELAGGYRGDVDKLMGAIEKEVFNIFDTVPEPITSSRMQNLTYVSDSIHETLKVVNYNYFKVTMLPNFYIGTHSVEWGNIVQIYPRTCIMASRGLGKTWEFDMALPIWKLYGYRRATDLNPIDLSIQRRREGLIVTNEYRLGSKILSNIVSEIKENPQLWERLKPEFKDEGFLGRERIETKNGGEINLRSAGSSCRGLHPDWIVVDDYGNMSWLYSGEQREKAIEAFYGDIMKTIERGGTVNVIGTPFHRKDLYAYIRENDKTFKFFEYPAIMPDGTIVAPHRWNFEELKKEYETNGSLIFSREILVVPISDNSSIFPWGILERAFTGMVDYRLVYNRNSFPIKFKYVSIGCDFAISGKIGSDYSVFAVWGIDSMDNYWLLHVWRKNGASHNEQLAKLKELERDFMPDEIVAESNGFQRVMAELGREHGIKNITEFTTTGWNKKDLYEGLPSIAVLFENGRIKLPRGDKNSIEVTDWLCSEFNSITIKPDSGKLESSDQHDDGPMACFFAIKCISVNKNKEFNFVMV